MSGPAETTVAVNGSDCRVWTKGAGAPLGVLAGFGGYVDWPPFLDRLAESRRVVVPSLPGYPGADGHRALDTTLDWIVAVADLLEASDLAGADLVGLGPGGALAAEIAACMRPMVRRLVLIAPLGLFDEDAPIADIWAQRGSELPALMSAKPDEYAKTLACPEAVDAIEWQVVHTRASEAAARLLWPTGDIGLRKRLHRITAHTLLIWGSNDRVVPRDYAKHFAEGIVAPVETRTIEGAGHRVDFDAPDALAAAILAFVG